jgi:hypothetical protein
VDPDELRPVWRTIRVFLETTFAHAGELLSLPKLDAVELDKGLERVCTTRSRCIHSNDFDRDSVSASRQFLIRDPGFLSLFVTGVGNSEG